MKDDYGFWVVLFPWHQMLNSSKCFWHTFAKETFCKVICQSEFLSLYEKQQGGNINNHRSYPYPYVVSPRHAETIVGGQKDV